jgi:hypothetical protein
VSEYGANTMYLMYFPFTMYVHGKMRPVETTPEMGGTGLKENSGRSNFKYDIFDI